MTTIPDRLRYQAVEVRSRGRSRWVVYDHQERRPLPVDCGGDQWRAQSEASTLNLRAREAAELAERADQPRATWRWSCPTRQCAAYNQAVAPLPSDRCCATCGSTLKRKRAHNQSSSERTPDQ